MKKILIVLISLLIIVLAMLFVVIKNNESMQADTLKFNKQYEIYLNNIVKGTEIATVINKATDNNEKYEIAKDEKNRYIQDNKYSIKISVKFVDSEKYYDMEAISGLGIEEFISNFSQLNFKCTEISYHKQTNRVSKLIFTEIEETQE